MIDASPSPADRLLPASDADGGLGSFLDRRTDRYRFYGSGKAALRDGLDAVAEPGDGVLLPAYVPDALVEPLSEIGLDVRHYAITEALGPDLSDLRDRADAATAAVLTVDYFGFPQPDRSSVADLAARRDWVHVADAAHAALSLVDGEPLAARSDLGFASLRKVFPVPDGACLFLPDGAVAERFEPSRDAGVRASFTADDWAFAFGRLVADAVGATAPGRRLLDALAARARADAAESDPSERYETAKGQMSQLTARVVARSEPAAVRAQRRANYRAWRRGVRPRGDVRPVFDRLPPGVCPQLFPMRTPDPDRVLADLEDCGVRGAYTWPQLPDSVRGDSTYDTANRLAREIVTVPLHQRLDPLDIRVACRRFADR